MWFTPMHCLPVKGFRLASSAAGIRYSGRHDLVVISCAEGTRSAAVFTRNRFSAAPVEVARKHLHQQDVRALLINSGNANAGTGEQGLVNAVTCCQLLAEQLGCEPAAILPFSTGVIGAQLPVAAFANALPGCVENLSEDVSAWENAARAIMTTDTVPKCYSRQFEIAGTTVTITGMAKGAGMIRPDMATMLAFIMTDALVSSEVMKLALNQAVNVSFNRITVDGDTSTNDACVLLASGAADHPEITSGSEEYELFTGQLVALMQDLAKSIIRDAEGATKFITLNVSGADSEEDCLAVAYTVAESPLVKTAFFASDPNWGRILAAIGRAPVSKLDINAVGIRLNGVSIVSSGEPDPEYTELAGKAAMADPEIVINISLGHAGHAVTVWTSDLSHEYVRINAEYRS